MTGPEALVNVAVTDPLPRHGPGRYRPAGPSDRVLSSPAAGHGVPPDRDAVAGWAGRGGDGVGGLHSCSGDPRHPGTALLGRVDAPARRRRGRAVRTG